MTLHTDTILTLQETGPRRIFMADVMEVVTKFYHVSVNDLRSTRRQPLYVRAKQAAYFLGCTYTRQSYMQIAARLNKDHSTIIWGERRVKVNPDKYEPELSRCISELQRKSISEPQPSVPRTAVAATGAVPQASAPVAPHSGAR